MLLKMESTCPLCKQEVREGDYGLFIAKAKRFKPTDSILTRRQRQPHPSLFGGSNKKYMLHEVCAMNLFASAGETYPYTEK
jgi:hypothetical protein